MEIRVRSKRFDDEYTKNEGNVQLWKRKVSGHVVYVRRELAINRFFATVARNGFKNDVAE